MNGFSFQHRKLPENTFGKRFCSNIFFDNVTMNNSIFDIFQANATPSHSFKGVNTDFIFASFYFSSDAFKVYLCHEPLYHRKETNGRFPHNRQKKTAVMTSSPFPGIKWAKRPFLHPQPLIMQLIKLANVEHVVSHPRHEHIAGRNDKPGWMLGRQREIRVV